MKSWKGMIGAGLVAVVFQSHAGVPRPTPADFSAAPKDLRAFLIKAREADRIRDPLKRCLAYPDYPGNHWPKGLAKAECHYRFDPHITLGEVRRAVDAGHFKALDRRFAADLARHFSKRHFSPVIHRDFEEIHSADTADLKAWGRLTRIWLDRDPHSAFALTARGEYFRAMTWTTRGEQWASDVPAKDMQRATAYAEKAIALYQRAVKIEPRMLPAYISLMDVSRLDSRYEIAQDALVSGSKVDPYCKVLTGEEMAQLEPRWGGSYRAMEALSKRIKNDVKHRTLLGLNTAYTEDDMADMLMRAENYKQAYAVLKPTLLETSWPVVFEDAARVIDNMQVDQPWKRLSYLLEASRFQQGGDYISYSRGVLMFRLTGDYEWSIPSLEAATSQMPDDGWEHLYLGIAYMNTMQLTKARDQLLVARKHPKTRAKALLDLVAVSMNMHHPRQAKRYLDTYSKAYPDEASAWYFRGFILLELHDVKGAKTAFRTFENKADRSNIDQIQYLRVTRRLLRDLDADPEHARYIHR